MATPDPVPELGRVLQNALWNIEDGETALDPAQGAIATARCVDRRSPGSPPDRGDADLLAQRPQEP